MESVLMIKEIKAYLIWIVKTLLHIMRSVIDISRTNIVISLCVNRDLYNEVSYL